MATTEPKSRLAREGQEQQQKERPYLANEAAWDSISTPEFGGQADILAVGIGEFVGPFEYMGHQPMIMEGGKSVTVHTGIGPDGDTYRLPIAASFLRAIDQAEVIRGDTFMIRRSDDVKKKAGIGKGQMMQIFALKVKSRVNRPAPVAQPAVAAA